jgi:Amt family ammonium transporter
MNPNASDLDFLWIVFCGFLVLFMQAGFLCLETGLTRRKNSINVAAKNLADFCVTAVIFWGLGFGLMFGASEGGWYGTDRLFLDASEQGRMLGAFFWFQLMFCGAAVTIMSGATAERMRLVSYLVISLLVAGLIYPVFGHWAWAGLDAAQDHGWLRAVGFVDFAGSTVVHSVGGWVALAALLIIGPRRGRFAADGTPRAIPASSLPLATLGGLLLLVGLLGFNGGSSLALDDRIAGILINTILAGAVGALSAGSLGFAVRSRLNVTQFVNGCLAGLVAITAGCFAVSSAVACLIGLVGGMISIGGNELLDRLKVDDAVGAVPVHLGAGIWGTLAVGLYGDLQILGTGLTRGEQVGVQLLGIVMCAVWSFGVAYVLLRLFNSVAPLRVPADHEDMGLNLAEHGENEDYEIPVEVIAKIRGAAAVGSQHGDRGSDSVDTISEQGA